VLRLKFRTVNMRLLLENAKVIEIDGPADVTRETTDAIVNAANSSLLGGGGVDGAIHDAGGPAILAECRQIVDKIGRLAAGNAVITTGGNLRAKHVIHTVGPVFRDGNHREGETLASCYRESIRLADEHKLASISFPAISTGAYGYPVNEAAPVALSAAIEGLASSKHVMLCRFVLFDASTVRAFEQAAGKLQSTSQVPFHPRKGPFMRKKVIAANWKMYKTPEQARDFLREFLPLAANHTRDEIVVCPPFLDLPAALESAKGSNVAIGAQNVHWKEEGAFTGETSVKQLLALDIHWAIIGHSERRQYFGETDDTVNLRLKMALEAGLTPICCVGEVLEEREAGATEDVLRRQCVRAFHAISAKKAAKLVVAYEPVWAIGTGKTATPKIAAEAHAVIRQEASRIFGEEFAAKLRILYGGSVKPENASALMAQEEIDGALVGGASLDPKSFATIVKY
jgi:triosephosphate isomerase (TIM)